jgi:hypothetical protein
MVKNAYLCVSNFPHEEKGLKPGPMSHTWGGVTDGAAPNWPSKDIHKQAAVGEEKGGTWRTISK